MALIYEKKSKIAYLTLNRPEALNAFDPETAKELEKAWRDFDSDPDVWVAIITGTGDKAFCAGADLKKFIPLRTATPEIMLTSYLTLKGINIYKPIIAAVNGYCLAGGMELLESTDIRIAAEHATFALPEPRWGIMPGGGSTVKLVRQIPYCRAMEILLVADRISAQEAYHMGLINKVVPLPELMPTATRIAERICENGPLAVRTIKESVIKCQGEENFLLEQYYTLRLLKSEDAKEGPKAFAEKRKPNFQGK